MAIRVSTAGFVVAEKCSVCDCLGQRAAEVAKGELPFVKDDLNKSDLFGPQAFGTYKWWWGRLKMDLDMMDYIDEPETVIETIKEFEVNSPSELLNLKSAGVNSLVMLGLMEE